MTQRIWRIASDTPQYQADDLSGAGAKSTGGRWNAVGLPMIYCAENRALACLETIVHLAAGGLPFNRYLIEVDLPDDIWAAAEIASSVPLAVGWDAQPAAQVSIAFGSAWLASRRSLALVVPSTIVAEERCILINPAHHDIGRLQVRKVRRWLYDPRLARTA